MDYENETTIFKVHHNPVVFLKHVFLALLFLIIWILCLVIFPSLREGLPLVAGIFFAFLLISYSAAQLLKWKAASLTLTTRRLIYSSGVFTKKTSEIPVSKITRISVSQSLTGRMLGFGDIIVEWEGEQGSATFPKMPHPNMLKDEILGVFPSQEVLRESKDLEAVREIAREVALNQPTSKLEVIPPERPPIYSEIVDQIERLEGMLRRGTISSEEFVEAKQKLLDRLGKENDVS
ncbi:MAG: PH domain-containing protein [Actinomycetota bacterium]|nr:PH domain-containing protein [Actinomycetota bacterium]